MDKPEFGTIVYHGATFDHAAAPTRPIEGTVRDKDTGRPLAGISIRSERFAGNVISGQDHVRTTTGADGRYRLVGMPAGSGNRITANPGPAQPYLGAGAESPAEPAPSRPRSTSRSSAAWRSGGRSPTRPRESPCRLWSSISSSSTIPTGPRRRDCTGERSGPAPMARSSWWVYPAGDWSRRGPSRIITSSARVPTRSPGPIEHGWFQTDPHICHPERLHAIVGDRSRRGCRVADLRPGARPGDTLSGTVVGPDGKPLAGCTAIDLCPHTMSCSMVKLTSGTFTAGASIRSSLDPWSSGTRRRSSRGS